MKAVNWSIVMAIVGPWKAKLKNESSVIPKLFYLFKKKHIHIISDMWFLNCDEYPY